MARTDQPPAPRPSSGARRSLVTGEAIVDAARAVLRERGYEGFTIDEVARRARAGKPTIYRWWPSRADLLAAAYEAERVPLGPESGRGRFEDDVTAFARTVLQHWRGTSAAAALKGLVAEAAGSASAGSALASTLDAALTRPLSSLVAAAARRREIDGADADILVELASAFLLKRLLVGRPEDDGAALARIGRFLASGRGRKGGRAA